MIDAPEMASSVDGQVMRLGASSGRIVVAPILYVDVSRIRPGSLETVRELTADLVWFVHANEPQLILYDFFFDQSGSNMTCVALHPDSGSMELHMAVAWEKFRSFGPHIEQRSIDVYGEASPDVIARLHRKIEMLGSGSVSVHSLQAGFVRLGATASAGA